MTLFSKNKNKLLLLIVIIIFIISINNYSNKNNNAIKQKNRNDLVKRSNQKKEENDKNESKKEENDNIFKDAEEESLKSDKEEIQKELEQNITINMELIGEEEINLNVGEKYYELGVNATDSNGNDVTKYINIDNTVDTSKTGTYYVIYSYGKSIVVRTVNVR